ncbi:MAG: HAMP domain-containing histidine kinase [Clostridium sp.]|nr:HAMP domain-containing histidine kinase [Clostridium sp.]
MKIYKLLFAAIIALTALVFAAANLTLSDADKIVNDRPYISEIDMLAKQIEKNGIQSVDMSECEYVFGVEVFSENFYVSDYDYAIRQVCGKLYRFDYKVISEYRNDRKNVNLLLTIMAAAMIAIWLFILHKIMLPFKAVKDISGKAADGAANISFKSKKSSDLGFFKGFAEDMERICENTEKQKRRENDMKKAKKKMLMTLYKDIKEPLSEIRNSTEYLCNNGKKQGEAVWRINSDADRIESCVLQIIQDSREEFLSIDIEDSEFLLSDLIKRVKEYFSERADDFGSGFIVQEYADSRLNGDIECADEVLRNIIDNAVKYGDRGTISFELSDGGDNLIIQISNEGCTLPDNELLHIFDKEWRGSNVGSTSGSGMGLYICRRLMNKMRGKVFAVVSGSRFTVSVIFMKV